MDHPEINRIMRNLLSGNEREENSECFIFLNRCSIAMILAC